MNHSNSPALVPADADVRRRGLNPDQSFAVSAPAGSGKTGLLTQRILTLLARAEYPEQILAMTFTRKAADEMHQRILSALQLAGVSDVALNDLPNKNPHQQLTLELAEKVLQRDAEKNWQLLLAPHRLRIQTIDSFCQHIADQLPLSSGINGALAATENSAFLYHDAVREFFSLLNHPDYQQDLGLLLKHVDNKLIKLERLLVELLSKRNQWLSVLFKSANSSDATEVLKASLRRTIDDCLEQCQSIIAPYLGELIPLLQFSTQQLSAQQFTSQQAELTDPTTAAITLKNFDHNTQASWQQLNAWQQLANVLLTKNAKPDNCKWRKTVDTRLGFPSSKDKSSPEWLNKQAMLSLLADLSSNKGLLNCLRDVKALPNIVLSEQQDVIASLTRLLPRLVAQFQLTCRECGQCDFDEIAQAAVAALGDAQRPTDLALHLDYQIKHILVDEFQDTSLLQLNLLEKLTAGWEPDDGRTLFVVGDAMQSCYGFRDAKVGLFLRVRRYGIGAIPLEPLDLLVNFRSDGIIVNWVNRVFSQVLPDTDNPRRGAVAYRQAQAKSTVPPINTSVNAPANVPANASVQLLGFVSEEQHSSEIVKLVQHHLQQSDTDTIAILARGRGHLQSILRTLRDARIDWEAQDVDALRAQMAIVDLLSLTKACTDFSDRISWLSILRAPWCGLDMMDLRSLVDCAAHDRNLLWQQICQADRLPISDAGKNILRRLQTILAAAFDQSHRKPFRQWLEGIWLALGGPAAIANPTEADSATHFFELLEQYSGAWGIDHWENFERALDRLYAKSTQSARLQVMTLHKSKGLEFDVVILPHLQKTPRSDTKDLLLWEDSVDDHGNINFLLSPLAASGQDDHQENQLYDFLWREQSIARELESARLLYVACTRAIKHLVLCACLPLDPDTGAVKSPPSRSLLAKLWPVVEPEFVVHSGGNINSTSATENKPVLSKLMRLPHDRQAIAFPPDQTLANYRRPAFFHQDDLPTAEALYNRYQRYCGTMIHRALENACRLGVCRLGVSQLGVCRPGQSQPGAENYACAEQTPIWSIQLAQLGVPSGERPALLETIGLAMERTLADPKGRWLLDNSHQQSVCEWQLSGAAADSSQINTREWIIDRSFVDAGVRWVIDYKTSVPRSGQSVDNFLLQEANHYREQLTNYQQVVHSLDPQYPVHIALYFPLLAQFYPLNTLKIQ